MMTLVACARALKLTTRTLARYKNLGAPVFEGPEAVHAWMLANGYTGAPGRSPYRAVQPDAPRVSPPPPVTAPSPPRLAEAIARPTVEEVGAEEGEVYATVQASENPLNAAKLLLVVEQAAYKRAQRKILERDWLQREEIERLQTEQAAALQRRLAAFADRIAPRVYSRAEAEIRALLAGETRSLLQEWYDTGRIE